MENHRTITTIADELPQEVIQLIQSMIQSSHYFEGGREAARTTLVSKSWYRAWSTRPDLVFARYNFPSSQADLLTLKRYEDLNLNIRSLRLVMFDGVVSLAEELVVKAIKLGVVDLTIHIMHRNRHFFVLPEELLQSQTLARLILRGSFTINLSPLKREKKKKKEEEEVTCSNLKSLKLKGVAINGDLFRDLISRCPLIEKFKLYSVYETTTSARTSTSTHLMDREFDKLHDYFPKLKYLSLEIRYAHDLWAKFACLKKLKILVDIHYDDDLIIRIPSLECITIHLQSCVNVEFDFPNIREFKWRGDLPRRFELKTRRDEWESEIYIFFMEYGLSGEWFSRLSQFLRMLSLSRSRVSLSMLPNVDYWDEFNYEPRYFGDGLAIPPVEKLTLWGHKVTLSFLDALFWSCRPKFVEIHNRCLFGLKKVNEEKFQQLRSLPWETFYHVSSDEEGYDVRFQLN